ncbi:MAG: hypothetical protein V4465_02190 [Patescibacteria group bacterium]
MSPSLTDLKVQGKVNRDLNPEEVMGAVAITIIVAIGLGVLFGLISLTCCKHGGKLMFRIVSVGCFALAALSFLLISP